MDFYIQSMLQQMQYLGFMLTFAVSSCIGWLESFFVAAL